MLADPMPVMSYLSSFSERLSRSIEYLNYKAQSHNAIAAHDVVAAIVSEQQKYVLYRELFPKEWKCSRASFHRRGTYDRYSERANEFFNLVNTKCFPIIEPWYDNPDQEFEQFVIQPLNIDLCCEEISFDDIRISYAFGLIFYIWDDAWDFLNYRFGVSAKDFPDIRREPHGRVWSQNESLFGRLIRLVDHSTGNVWLDGSHCNNYDWYDWDLSTIRELSKEFEAAQELTAGLKELDVLIEAGPKKMLRALIEFWNTGKLPKGMKCHEQK